MASPEASRFQALLESAPDAIVLADADGRIRLVNRRGAELFGYEPGELLGRDVEQLVPERLRPTHVRHRGGYVADPRTREMGAGLALYGLRKDGGEFPVEISLSPLVEGDETLVITILRDVSERRAAELERLELASEQAAHAEAESGRERLAVILDAIDAIVWEADAERRQFRFVSRRAEEKLGYPVEQWHEEAHFWRRLVHPNDLELAELFFNEAVGRGDDHEYEYRVVGADGRVVWVRDRVRLARAPGGEVHLTGIMVDVTARRELEEQLLQSQKMDAVGQLAGGVAHDFNNLLVVIRGYTEMLVTQATDETSLGQLREISGAAERARALTAQLLAFGRRAPTVSEVVDLSALLRGIEPMLRRLIDEDVALRIRTDATTDPVRADPGQLEQVLVNLVINARDAMKKGGEVQIAASTNDVAAEAAEQLGIAPGRYAVVTVSDTGSGMSEDTKGRIFEPFFTTKEQGKGTGLGLATVYGIVEQAGGKIAVDTELGHGTTFSVYFPCLPTGAVEGEPEHMPETAAVLLVEDDIGVRTLVKTVLEQESYRVHEAANGREALELLQRHGSTIDLILSDVVMPDVSGPEFVERVRSLGLPSKVLYMSGYADSQLLNRGLSEGTVQILHKPFTPAELVARVGDLCAADADA